MESAQSPDPVWLSKRCDHLERAYRRLKCAMAVGLLGLAALGVMGQAASGTKVIAAERFVVRDAAGVTRAALGLHEGAPILALFDPTGTTRVSVAVASNGAAVLTLGNAGGKAQAGMVALAGGGTSVTLSDPNGMRRLGIALLPEHAHAPAIVLAGPSGATQGQLTGTNLVFLDDTGAFRTVLGESRFSPTPSLLFLGPAETVRWQAP